MPSRLAAALTEVFTGFFSDVAPSLQPAKRVDYHAYIQSAAWRAKADACKERAGYRCMICYASGAGVMLDAHHRTYARLGEELDTDLICLCRDCHGLFTAHKRLARYG